MSSLFPSADNPRPRQVTFGATLAVTGGVVLLAALVDMMSRLESMEVTEALRDALRSVGLASDISVEQARDVLKYSIMVLAVLSAAAVVLGIFTLKRDQGARIALTVVIGTIGLIGLLGGPATWLITLYVGVSVMLLWSRPARAWFAGTYVPRPPGGPPSKQPNEPEPRPPPPPSGRPDQPPWMPPPGPRPPSDDESPGSDRETPQGPPPGWAPPPYGPPPPFGPPPYGPPPGWRPPPGWTPPAYGPPPGWPQVPPPPPPPSWRPEPSWPPPPEPAADSDPSEAADGSPAEDDETRSGERS